MRNIRRHSDYFKKRKFNKDVLDFGYKNAKRYQKYLNSNLFKFERLIRILIDKFFIIPLIFSIFGLYFFIVIIFDEKIINGTTPNENTYIIFSLIVFIILAIAAAFINDKILKYNICRIISLSHKSETGKDLKEYEILEYSDSRNDIRLKIRHNFIGVDKNIIIKEYNKWVYSVYKLENNNFNGLIAIISKCTEFIGQNTYKINKYGFKLVNLIIGISAVTIFFKNNVFTFLKLHQGFIYFLYCLVILYIFLMIVYKRKAKLLDLINIYIEELAHYISILNYH
ncbi:hypothetical protein WHY38_15540 (plasmid) [Clostridium perfringens]|uniref:hypothetical protein n=1 Tax=Clostridium perfringens TaxID=1502 RepID=UPI0030D081F1